MYVGLRPGDPRKGLYDLAFLAGRCANLYQAWAQPDKRRVKMNARPKPRRQFSSSGDYEERMADESKSPTFVLEWLKDVPPGSPGGQDVS
jgi:hypothetical protein